MAASSGGIVRPNTAGRYPSVRDVAARSIGERAFLAAIRWPTEEEVRATDLGPAQRGVDTTKAMDYSPSASRGVGEHERCREFATKSAEAIEVSRA